MEGVTRRSVLRIEIGERFCERISSGSGRQAILSGITRHFGTFARVCHLRGERRLFGSGPCKWHVSHLELLNCWAIRCGSCFRSTFCSRIRARFSTHQLSRVMSPCRTHCCSSLCAHRLHLLDDRLITAVRCTPADRFRIIADARRREYAYRVSGVRFGITDSSDNL